jgi:hypothetical protein
MGTCNTKPRLIKNLLFWGVAAFLVWGLFHFGIVGTAACLFGLCVMYEVTKADYGW